MRALLLAILLLGLVFSWVARSAAPPTSKRLSAARDGADSNGDSGGARISADGRWVVFASDASNLVPNDGNGQRDVFVAPTEGGAAERVSVSSSGAEANGASMPNIIDVNGGASISGDGRYVAFQSAATNLVESDTNGVGDIFVRDRKARRTVRASVGSPENEANGASLHPALSPNGRSLAFSSAATNLAKADTNGEFDVFLRDLRKGTTRRVSITTRGRQGNGGSLRPSVSNDGRLVVWESFATNLAGRDANRAEPGLDRMDVFARDLKTRRTQRISVSSRGQSGAGGGSFTGFMPSISRNRRYVVFDSGATNLVRGDTNGVPDAFVRDLEKRRTTRVSLGPKSAQGDAASGLPSISANARYVAFESDATTFGLGGNASTDVFVRDLRRRQTTRVSVGKDGADPDGVSYHASIAADGATVSFASNARNLTDGDANAFYDVYARRVR